MFSSGAIIAVGEYLRSMNATELLSQNIARLAGVKPGEDWPRGLRADIARDLQIGQGHLSDILMGRKGVSLEKLDQLARRFAVPVAELFREDVGPAEYVGPLTDTEREFLVGALRLFRKDRLDTEPQKGVDAEPQKGVSS